MKVTGAVSCHSKPVKFAEGNYQVLLFVRIQTGVRVIQELAH